jgi:hypothetical protein
MLRILQECGRMNYVLEPELKHNSQQKKKKKGWREKKEKEIAHTLAAR